MKDSIQESTDEVSIVVYDAPLPPKYFRLKKSFIRAITVIAPIVVFLIVSAFFVWGVIPRLEKSPSLSLPTLESEQEKQIRILSKKVESIEAENQNLVAKLSSAPGEASAEDPYLMMIKKPYGMQNLLSQNRVFLESMEIGREPNKTTLKFQLVSSTPDKKVTGHIIVFMISDTHGVMAYPMKANESIRSGIKYAEGESFSVSRMRPTSAEFKHPTVEDNVRFLIYIFNREGDLLLLRETEAYKIGSKS